MASSGAKQVLLRESSFHDSVQAKKYVVAVPPSKIRPFFTRELRACARASCRYDVGNGTRSLARSIGGFL